MHEVVHRIFAEGEELVKNYKFVSIPRIGDNIRLQYGDSVEISAVVWETTDPEMIMAVTLISSIRHMPASYYKERGYV